EFWQLHDRGPNWAEATEGSPAVWARERYEWSGQPRRRDDAGLERLPARWHVDIDRRAAQRRRQPLRVVLERRFKGKGWPFYPAVALFGRRMFKRNLQKTLNVLGRSGS